MRHILIVLAVIVGLNGPVYAENTEIEATIGAQIEAFKSDDFARAFTFASPGIQGIFRTPENFAVMVQRGYPMVWRPSEVRFLELREIAGNLWQKVMITDAAGTIHILDYQMISLENGWKINAVRILSTTEASA